MNEKVHVLFVCAGNTCRSPMAAGVANALHSAFMLAESAGMTLHGTHPANPLAIKVAGEALQIDLSSHRTRTIDAFNLSTVDLVIAMDPAIAGDLRQRYPIPGGRLTAWNVPDPYGQGEQAYKETLETVCKNVQQLSASLATMAPASKIEAGAHLDPAQTTLEQKASRLAADLKRWRRDLDDPHPRGTLFEGVWKKAIGSLEALLRDVLRCYLEVAGWSYDKVRRRYRIRDCNIDGMNFGSLIFSFNKIDSDLTQALRSRSNHARDQLHERLLYKPMHSTLVALRENRNPFVHHGAEYNEYSEDEEVLREQLRPVLDHVEAVLTDELVHLAVVVSSHASALK